MKLAEYMSQIYNKIKRYLKPSSKQLLQKVQTTSPDGTLNTHTTQTEIEEILLNHHQTHFHQAQGTSFTVEPLTSFFGHATELETSKVFRNGNIDTTNVPIPQPDVHDFLKVLSPHPTDPIPIDVQITLSQLKQGFRIWQESTRTSATGCKLSLYKMWLQEPGNNDDIISGNTFFTTILDVIHLA